MKPKKANVTKNPGGELTITPYTREMLDKRREEIRPPIRAMEDASFHLKRKKRKKKKEEE